MHVLLGFEPAFAAALHQLECGLCCLGLPCYPRLEHLVYEQAAVTSPLRTSTYGDEDLATGLQSSSLVYLEIDTSPACNFDLLSELRWEGLRCWAACAIRRILACRCCTDTVPTLAHDGAARARAASGGHESDAFISGIEN